VDERAVITGHRSQREDKLSGKSGTMESPVSRSVYVRSRTCLFYWQCCSSSIARVCAVARQSTVLQPSPPAPSLLSDSSPHSIRRLETAYTLRILGKHSEIEDLSHKPSRFRQQTRLECLFGQRSTRQMTRQLTPLSRNISSKPKDRNRPMF
jgi:hypothetical protein